MYALQMSAFGINFPLRLMENCLICYKCIIKCKTKQSVKPDQIKN